MLPGFDPHQIQDLKGAQQAIVLLLNLIEEFKQENSQLRETVQQQRDEISRLKGEQGKPDIKPNKEKNRSRSSRKKRQKPKTWHKSSKLQKEVTAEQVLCWVHDGRHYKRLTPAIEYHQKLLAGFQQEYWKYYAKLEQYRADPQEAIARQLRQEFDALFSTVTGYEEPDKRITKSQAKKEQLLLALHYPEMPSHNNPAELGARQRARKRDVSFGPRTEDGLEAWDTFMTLAETAKKLGVSFYAYVQNRVSGSNQMPDLADLIQQRAPA